MDDKNGPVGSQKGLKRLRKVKVDKTSESGLKVARKRKIWLFVVIGLVFVAACVAGAAVLGYTNGLKPVDDGVAGNCVEKTADSSDAAPCIQGDFEVLSGWADGDVAAALVENGFIRNELVFKIYLRLNNKVNRIIAGVHKINTKMSVQEIVEVLQKEPEVEVFRATFLPGATIADNKEVLVEMGYSQEEVDAAFAKEYDHPVLKGKPAGNDLEGYMYGETYEFFVGTSVEDIIKRTLDELWTVVQNNDLEARFAAQGLNLFEGITLSSIVQKEVSGADSNQVAQVFLTRLEIGMVLGSDVTYHYAAKKLGVEPDYTLDSPYNTRIYAGLPPGPISNPGITAMLAVAEPAAGKYLYFLSGDDDVTYFAYTEAEHEQNIILHCQVKCSVM